MKTTSECQPSSVFQFIEPILYDFLDRITLIQIMYIEYTQKCRKTVTIYPKLNNKTMEKNLKHVKRWKIDLRVEAIDWKIAISVRLS